MLNIKGGFRNDLCSGNHPARTQTLLEDMETHRKSDKATFGQDMRKKIFTVKVVKHHQKLPKLAACTFRISEKGVSAARVTPPHSIGCFWCLKKSEAFWWSLRISTALLHTKGDELRPTGTAGTDVHLPQCVWDCGAPACQGHCPGNSENFCAQEGQECQGSLL